ncbi:MAG: acyl-CoA synthetase [Deltaproteobacteria bacterium]|nr:acyl-CoA synthetase [Deltaproteobacteria bacterium]
MPFPDYEPSLPVFLQTRIERFGERPLAVLNDDRIGYAEAGERSARLARGLLAAGITKGTRVGLLMPNGPDWVVAWLAAARIGAVVVPLNTFYKPRELGWVLKHADVHTLLSVPSLLNNDYVTRLETAVPELAGQEAGALVTPELPYLRAVIMWGKCDRSWAGSHDDLEAAAKAKPSLDDAFLTAVEACVSPSDTMIVIYSSGSTADPKGVLHSHGTLIRHSFNLNSYRDLVPEDRVFSPMPFFWIGGFVFTLMACMHAGASMVCEEAFDAGETLALLEREKVTIAAGWPHYAKAMMDHPSFRERDLSSIRSGNLYEILPEDQRPQDPELRSNSLGMAETCGPHSIDRMDVDLPERLRGSFGRAPEGVEHKVVDPETGETLPAGTAGEICVRGYNLMQGLHKVEREDVFDPDGFYHTGDGGLLDTDGVLFFRARLGDVIKTAGANVAPREVEVVLDGFAEVQASFVVGVPDAVRGQNVAAAIVLDAGQDLSAEDCRRRLREELSAYKVPRHIFFAATAELPFTDSGKIDKPRLGAQLAERIAAGDAG